MKKRILSMSLVICIVLALLPSGTVFATDAGTNDVYDVGADTGIVPASVVDDHTPPEVTGVYMNSPGGTVTVGDKLEFLVATEDESGISRGMSWLDFVFVCVQNHAHTLRAYPAHSYEAQDFYDENTKQAKFELTISDEILNGTYKLSYVKIQDIYENNTLLYPAGTGYPENPGNPGNIDFDSVCFTVTGSSTAEDHNPPIVTAVFMESPGKVVTVGDKIEFSVATEDESGISRGMSWLDFVFVCVQNHAHTLRAYPAHSYEAQDFYDENTKQAKFELTISDEILNGTYKLSYVKIQDIYENNTLLYPAGTGYPENPGNPGNIDFDSIYFTIAIPDIEPEAVSIPQTLSLPVRSTQTIRPTVTPVDSLPKWTWTSADTSIAEVAISENNKSCTITGVAPGTTIITGTTQNGLTATCTVTVTDAPVPESGTINESYQVGVGGYVDILPVLAPADATTLYEVTSDNPHVASVATATGQEGIRIQGNVPGKATITIRGANGLVMSTVVTVGRESNRQHEKVTDPGYPATCITPGRSERVRCSVCWYVFTESEELPATGEHTYGDWRVVQEATATTAGSKERYCAYCGNRETESIPATGSSTNPGGTTTPGGTTGPSVPSGPDTGNYGWTPPTAPSQSISAGDQKLPITVSNGAVNVSATDKQIENAIADSKETGIVEIDMTTVANASEVKIPQKMVNAIQDSSDVSGLSVTAKSGSIEMSAAALNTISNALTGSGDQLSLKIDTIDVNKIPSTQKYPIANVLNTAVFVELSAAVIHQDGSRDLIHEFNGDVTVSIPYEQPANVAGRQVIACHIADDGAITYFPVRYESGMVTFTTTHFSTFAVVESYAAAFSDIDVGAWYMLGVEHALNQKFMNGVGNGLFAPNANLSRGMLAQILYNKEGKPIIAGGSTFVDVQSNVWYADAVAWASAEGIVDGYGNGSFGPNDDITREQLAVMLWRYAGKPVPPNLLLNFTDAYQASDYAQDALRWAVEKGIISGKGNGILDPTGKATRAEAAKMLKNYIDTVL